MVFVQNYTYRRGDVIFEKVAFISARKTCNMKDGMQHTGVHTHLVYLGLKNKDKTMADGGKCTGCILYAL